MSRGDELRNRGNSAHVCPDRPGRAETLPTCMRTGPRRAPTSSARFYSTQIGPTTDLDSIYTSLSPLSLRPFFLLLLERWLRSFSPPVFFLRILSCSFPLFYSLIWTSCPLILDTVWDSSLWGLDCDLFIGVSCLFFFVIIILYFLLE